MSAYLCGLQYKGRLRKHKVSIEEAKRKHNRIRRMMKGDKL